MEAVFAKIAQETSKFALGDEEIWRELYEPLYKPSAKAGVTIKSDVRYGPADRNMLDVYFCETGSTNAEKPVILFEHGGGFFSGDKAWSESCYANIGCYFAKQGIVVVCANHQLVPNVTYPGGADDVQLTREWIFENIASEEYGRGSVDKVILFGHSSGGAHVAANLYAAGDPKRVAADQHPAAIFPPVAGVIYLDVPFWYDRQKSVRQKTIRSYYGSDAEEVWGPLSALGLFRNLPEDSPLLDANKLPVYIGSVKWEVKETIDGIVEFFHAYRERSKPAGSLPGFHVLDNHNHLSNVLSIGTEDTAQAEELLRFILECVKKVESRGKASASDVGIHSESLSRNSPTAKL